MGMVMTFFQATNTPLLFHGTAPTTPGQYAGACIILVLLAILACVLISMKAVLQNGAWAARPQQTEPSLLRRMNRNFKPRCTLGDNPRLSG